jgi:putative NADH-flavin reductase
MVFNATTRLSKAIVIFQYIWTFVSPGLMLPALKRSNPFITVKSIVSLSFTAAVDVQVVV